MNIQMVKIVDAFESPTNPREVREDQAFKDLVASIKEKGVLVPVIARQMGAKGYEIIAGNRRLRAAKAAGLKDLPAEVRDMDDNEAREVQIIENLQRADVHPLDEGRAYRDLIEESKYEIPAVAAKVGKSVDYVKQRLFLTNLETKVADAYRKGKITDGHAVLIARLDLPDQVAALKECLDGWNLPTLKNFKEWIGSHIYKPMENQPWLKSEELQKVVGDHEYSLCGQTNQSLFGNVRAGACTNLKCWAIKMAKYLNYRANTENLLPVSKEYGQPAKGLMSKSDYTSLSTKKKEHCEFARQAIVGEGVDMGSVMWVCADENCKKHRGEHSSSGYSLSPAEKAKRKADREKAKKAKTAMDAKMHKALDAIKWPLPEVALEALLELGFSNAGANTHRSVAKRRNLEVKKVTTTYGDYSSSNYDYTKALRDLVKDMDKTEKVRLAFELLIDTGYDGHHDGIGKLVK